VVRKARHLSSDTRFAVKIVRKPAFPSSVADAMFSREIRLLERLKHVGYAVLDVKTR
jgi:serine/threonine protein kinase